MESSDEVDHSPLPDQVRLMNMHIGNVVHVNPDIREYFNEARTDESVENEEWLLKPELPSSAEILGTDLPEDEEDCVQLMPNHIEGPWPSRNSYLRAHYELLREDSIAPLRDAVAYVRDEPKMMDSKEVSIYDMVHITGITFAQRGLAFRIQLSTNRAGRNIIWEYSKRLISGTIVALSPVQDCFRTECAIAVVAARPLDGVKQQPPEIDIFFARPEEVNFDPQQEWIMVEAKCGYYESLRHTMTALQKMGKENFPLADHICSLGPNVDPPEYIKEDPIVDIQSSLSESGEEGKVDILHAWPQLPTGDLDGTQWEALEQILTKKLSIVQGPPGTGKTFVSVVALKIMLANMKPSDPPIFIAAQTNHALDQLLTHIASFEKNCIRLGARSTDFEIKKRTLFNVRQKESTATIQGSVLGSARRKYRSLVVSISELLQVFNQEDGMSPLPSSLFFKYGVLTEDQYESLDRGAQGWIRPGADETIDPLVAWIGDEWTEFQVQYSKENFGFSEDEIDLEYEQLKELEAEQGVEEDDYEGLKGQFNIIRDGFCGRESGSMSDATAQEYLKCVDLWKIPPKARGSVYNVLRKLTLEKVSLELRKLLAIYDVNCEDLQIGKWERDHTILRNAKVIGMTTTGLSKYRPLLSSLNPRTILIEEAAEVIEAPISVASFNTLQQLILVGDHKQLRGHCSVQDLEGEPFYLDISMFERLVQNEMKYTTLKRQRRMAPEIRRLLTPIYGELQDHPSVQQRPGVPGMGDYRSFFFSHTWPENSDSVASKFNEIEAQMVVGFYTYLVLNGVPVDKITVLTFYNGQRKRLLKLIRGHRYLQGHYAKVVTVDSYQGEENDIVILSLVRSSKSNNIGFLSIDNRVCVALSRAKRGFYIFGNSLALSSTDSLWPQVISTMGEGGPETCRLGFQFPVTCSNHGRKTWMKDPSSWESHNGGCDLDCNGTLHCGHKCTMRCHSASHDQIMCTRVCNKTLPCGHICETHCSVNHTCACQCKLASEPAPATLVEEDPVPDFVKSRKVPEKELKLIKNYHAFANGGAQEQDALLRAKAAPKAKSKKQKPVRIPIGDLLGESTSSSSTENRDFSHSRVAWAKPQGTGVVATRPQDDPEYPILPSSKPEVPQGSLLD